MMNQKKTKRETVFLCPQSFFNVYMVGTGHEGCETLRSDLRLCWLGTTLPRFPQHQIEMPKNVKACQNIYIFIFAWLSSHSDLFSSSAPSHWLDYIPLSCGSWDYAWAGNWREYSKAVWKGRGNISDIPPSESEQQLTKHAVHPHSALTHWVKGSALDLCVALLHFPQGITFVDRFHPTHPWGLSSGPSGYALDYLNWSFSLPLFLDAIVLTVTGILYVQLSIIAILNHSASILKIQIIFKNEVVQNPLAFLLIVSNVSKR